MNVQFRSLTIKNFMSLVNETIDLQDLGVVLVKGINNYDPLFKSNGSGKSAIFDSILWVLTGYTSRGSSNVSNRNINPTGAFVELTMTIDQDEYIITRTDGYQDWGKSIKIIKNGEDISGSTFTKSKDILKSQLSFINYDVLTSIIILSQGLPSRLSSLKPSDRKSRLEYLSNTDGLLEEIQNKLQLAYSELSTKSAEVNIELTKLNTSITTNQSTIDSCNEKINQIKNYQSNSSMNDETAKNYEETIEKYKLEILTLREKYTTIVNMGAELSSKKSIVNNSINSLQTKIQDLTNRYKSVSSNICPTCGAVLQSSDSLKSHILEELNTVKLEYSSKLAEKNELDGVGIPDPHTYNNRIKELDSEILRLSNLLEEYRRMSSSIDSYQTTIDDCQSKINGFKDQLGTVTKQLSELNKLLDIHKYFKSEVSRKFRNFLLDGVITYLNKRLEYYSKYLFSNDQIVYLESNGNNIDIRLGNSYFEDLSGGEGRRVDIILQLAQRDLSRTESGFSCNLLVLDEILDYLDTDGIYSVLNMLEKESSSVDSLLIVTHKDELSVPSDTELVIEKGIDQLSRIRR